MQDELYSPRKAAQVVAYFALKQGGRLIEVLKAVELVYLADRESLRRWGAPILHEPRYALKLGPVNQTTMEYMNGERIDADGWSRIVSPRAGGSNSIGLQQGVEIEDLDEFSDAELEVLEHVWARHGEYESFPLAHWTHRPGNVPEWRDPKAGRLPIEMIDILRAVGFPDPEKAIDRVGAAAQHRARLPGPGIDKDQLLHEGHPAHPLRFGARPNAPGATATPTRRRA